MSLDYTPDRYTALRLVNANKISSIDTVLRRNDGRGLEPGVLASRLGMRNEGFIEQHLPPAGTTTPGHWPTRLSLRGFQLLSQYAQEHARRGDGLHPQSVNATDTILSGTCRTRTSPDES